MFKIQLALDSDPSMDIDDIEARLNLKKWSSIEDSILAQKVRINWIKYGDTITSFFYASL